MSSYAARSRRPRIAAAPAAPRRLHALQGGAAGGRRLPAGVGVSPRALLAAGLAGLALGAGFGPLSERAAPAGARLRAAETARAGGAAPPAGRR